MLSHAYNIVTYLIVVAPEHGQEVFNGLNTTDKMFHSVLMKTVKLPVVVGYETHMEMYTSTLKEDISLSS